MRMYAYLYNLMRNLGGGIGIALCTTFISRASQVYQNTLVANITPYNPNYTQLGQKLGHMLPGMQGMGLTYGLVREQSAMLAYINLYIIMAWACYACIPLVFLLRKADHGGGGGAAAMH